MQQREKYKFFEVFRSKLCLNGGSSFASVESITRGVVVY